MCSMWWTATPGMMRTGSNGLLFKNAQGEPDVLSLGELNAVEVSGRSSLEEYRSTPSEWPQQHTQVIGLMERRPGSIKPGKRPAEVHYVPCKVYEFATLKEVQFIRLMSHMTGVNLGIVLGRGTNFVRNIRERENIKTGYIWGNSEQDMNTAHMMWAKWNEPKTTDPWQ